MATGPNRQSPAPSPGGLPLLIEIGCEEIPARFLTRAQKDLGERLQAALLEGRLVWRLEDSEVGASPRVIATQAVETYSTPRRLSAYVARLYERQLNKVEEIVGPPATVAFDGEGKPTRAAVSFAEKNGANVTDLQRRITAKGEYVVLEKTSRGCPALDVLPEILVDVISGLDFPRSMYWESSKTRFVRPIRWVLALLGEGEQARTIPVEISDVRSSNVTYGHRTLGSGPVPVSGFDDCVRKLRQMGVELDGENRRERVRSEIKVLLEDSGLNVVEDRELEDWIVNSTEWPQPLLGSFEERSLRLPREILITVMRDHQHYFAVENRQGSLQPRFVTVLNVDGDRTGVIRQGHERVLSARFSDAEFFWNADQKIPLRDRLPMLERVTYQAKLGSYADKVRRMEAIADRISRSLVEQGKISSADAEHILHAVRLCKCDLTTQMVQEFTELQGVVGGLYAKAQGEPEAVWQAVYDHYLPLSAEGQLPRTIIGAVVSLADKLDSVVAGLAAGVEPTGSSDPFGLRRAGNGIIKLSIDSLTCLDLLGLLQEATQANLGLPPVADLFGQAAGFLRERAESFLENVAGLRFDTVRAVVQSFLGWAQPADALGRGKALERIRDSDDFVALSTAAKRTRNILTKSAKPEDLVETSDPVDEGLLTAGPEEELYRAYKRLRPILDDLAARGQYEEAFRALAELRPQVDRFFDKVLVMDDDLRVRRNRLNLLSKLNLLAFQRFAGLSQIESMTSSSVDASTS